MVFELFIKKKMCFYSYVSVERFFKIKNPIVTNTYNVVQSENEDKNKT